MPEVKYKLVPVGVRYDCDECCKKRGSEPPGQMRYMMEQPLLLTNPPLYQHECDKCGHIDQLRSSYPKIVYKKPSEV